MKPPIIEIMFSAEPLLTKRSDIENTIATITIIKANSIFSGIPSIVSGILISSCDAGCCGFQANPLYWKAFWF